MVNDILDFSKIEAGKLLIDPVECELSPALDSAMKTLAIHAHHKGIELLYRYSPRVPDRIVIDRDRVRQVVNNIVGNAIKFTGSGEVELFLDAEQLRRFGRAQFSVRDTGIGIPLDKQASVFQAFEQADGSITRRYGGTGLGLAICARVVNLMGGKLWLESQLGLGTTFFFTLPCETVKDGETAKPADWDKIEPASLRALVVDDNPASREILKEMLKARAFRRTCPRTAQWPWTSSLRRIANTVCTIWCCWMRICRRWMALRSRRLCCEIPVTAECRFPC